MRTSTLATLLGCIVINLKEQVSNLSALRESDLKKRASLGLEIDNLRLQRETLDKVSALFRALIDEEVNDGVASIEHLQTEGLRAVFNDQDLSVKAEVSESRGKISVDLTTIQNKDGEITEAHSLDAFGGAVTTVQSVLMRVGVIMTQGMRPLILLDESLPAFDDNYVHNMVQFLSDLCDRLKFDILLVTHNQSIVESAHKAYRLVRKGDEVKVLTIKG